MNVNNVAVSILTAMVTSILIIINVTNSQRSLISELQTKIAELTQIVHNLENK